VKKDCSLKKILLQLNSIGDDTNIGLNENTGIKMKKELKVVFAPGAFDQFEGTQEELDELQNEILSMFSGKTSEEIKAMSKPVDESDDHWQRLSSITERKLQ
jgi:hypothetical protein